MKLNGFPTSTSYCYNTPKGKDVRDIKHVLCVERPFGQRLSTTEDDGQEKSTRAKTVMVTFYAMKGREHLNSFLAQLGINMVTEERRMIERPVKEALKIFIIWVPFFVEVLQLFRENISSSVYIMFVFKPLHKLHLFKWILLKKYTFTYPGSDAMLSHPAKPVQERRLPSLMRKFVLWLMNMTLAVLEGDWSLPAH